MSEELEKAPSKGPGGRQTLGRFVVGLTALATIVGGVAAGFQIVDYLNKKPSNDGPAPKEPEEKLEAGWKRETLDGGMTVNLPQDWQKVDRDGLASLMRSTYGPGMDDPFGSMLGPSDVMTFVVEHSKDPNAPSVLAAFGLMDRKTQDSLDKQLEDARADPRITQASKVELPQGEALHMILKQWHRAPDGYEVPMLVDAYMIPKYDQTWMAMMFIEERDHLPYSGIFRKMVDSFRAPIKEPPPPGQ